MNTQQNRPTHLTLVIAVALVASGIAVTGCETDEVGLSVSAYFPCNQYDPQTQQNPFSSPVNQVEVCLNYSQGDLAPSCKSSSLSAGSAEFPSLKVGKPLRVSVEGSAGGGDPIAFGQTPPLVGQDGRLEAVHLMVSLVDQFGTATDQPSCRGLRCACSRMKSPRKDFTATVLHDGRILIAGGRDENNAVLDSAEIFDPNTGTFTYVANRMKGGRAGHSAVRLGNAHGYKVLLTGGENDFGTDYQQWRVAEYYDPGANAFFVIQNPMSDSRINGTATRLNDGRVLLAGGWKGEGAAKQYLNSMEIFDPDREDFTVLTGSLSEGRAYHTATLTIVGRGTSSQVLMAGGKNRTDALQSADVVEILDGGTTATVVARQMSEKRWGHAAAKVGLGDKVLIVGGARLPDDVADGGLDSMDMFDGFNNKDFVPFSALDTPVLKKQRWGLTLTELEAPAGSGVSNRGLLVVGGLDNLNSSVADVELLIPDDPSDPTTFRVDVTDSRAIRDSRTSHRGVRLPNGPIIVIGGLYRDSRTGTVEVLDSAEVYNPGPTDWCGTKACSAW